MKYKFSIVLVASIISLGTFSCQKEEVKQPGSPNGGNSNGNNTTQSQPLYFVASNWQLNDGGVYVSTFQFNINANDLSKAKAYVLINGTYMQIGQSISFQNGTLWATFSLTDVKINYQGSNMSPFSSVYIKVTFE